MDDNFSFVFNETEIFQEEQSHDYAFLTALAFCLIVGVVGNIFYLLKNAKLPAIPLKINDIQLYSVLLAVFNIIQLLHLGFVITSQILFPGKARCYTAIILVYVGEIGMVYFLLCLAKETLSLTRNCETYLKRSNRFEVYLEMFVYFGVILIIFFQFWMVFGSPWKDGDYCILNDEMRYSFLIFPFVMLLTELIISIIAFTKARGLFAEHSSHIKHVAKENFKISLLYNSCQQIQLFFFLINSFIPTFGHGILIWKILKVWSQICFIVFPFIFKLKLPPNEYTGIELIPRQ